MSDEQNPKGHYYFPKPAGYWQMANNTNLFGYSGEKKLKL